jgi:hypothetical protein
VWRLVRFSLIATLALSVAAPAGRAAPTNKIDAQLGALWTAVLQTPSSQNAFGTGGEAFGCWRLDKTVAPFGPTGVSSCTVKPGTEILVAASSFECSTFEGNGTTEAQLRSCARDSDVQSAPAVTVDGRAVEVSEAETALLEIVLPADNIFGLEAGAEGLSVAHGWVALLHPLPPGRHTIVIAVGEQTITTTIIVVPGP